MTKDEIKALAIRCGFTLREQPYGNMDLYPYIYDFAERLLKTQLEQMLAEGWRQCAKGQHTTQFCGQLEEAVKAERKRWHDAVMLELSGDGRAKTIIDAAIHAMGDK